MARDDTRTPQLRARNRRLRNARRQCRELVNVIDEILERTRPRGRRDRFW